MGKRPHAVAESAIAGDDEDDGSCDCVAALERDIRIFMETSKLPDGLAEHVKVYKGRQVEWFEEMSNAWTNLKTPLQTPADGTKFVFDMFCKVYPHSFGVFDIDDLLAFYGFPLFCTLCATFNKSDELKPLADDAPLNTPDELKPRAEDAPLNTPDELKPPDEVKPAVERNFPEFLLETLPVNTDQVTDGVNFTVFVEVGVENSYALPSKMMLLLNEHRKALAKTDTRRASQLLNEINTTEDYKMQSIHGVQILTRKYEIRLKGVYVPGIETSEGVEARDELAEMVNGKCLIIEVYSLDDKKRCVGDVYYGGVFLQGILLVQGSAWELDSDDAQLKKWMEHAENWKAGEWMEVPPDIDIWGINGV